MISRSKATMRNRNWFNGVVALFLVVALAPGCATTTTYETTWTDPSTPGYWSRPGRVVSVREIVQRQEGNPVGGALVGALILGSASADHAVGIDDLEGSPGESPRGC